MGVPDRSYEEKAVSSFGSANSKLKRRDYVARFGFSGGGQLRFLDIGWKEEAAAAAEITFFWMANQDAFVDHTSSENSRPCRNVEKLERSTKSHEAARKGSKFELFRAGSWIVLV